VLADQEHENGGVAVEASSVMKGSPPSAVLDGQQAHLHRVELGLRDHQLNELQWHRVATGPRDGSRTVFVLEEDLIGRVTVCEGLDVGDSNLPLQVCREVVQGTHRPAGAASVSMRSCGVRLSLV